MLQKIQQRFDAPVLIDERKVKLRLPMVSDEGLKRASQTAKLAWTDGRNAPTLPPLKLYFTQNP